MTTLLPTRAGLTEQAVDALLAASHRAANSVAAVTITIVDDTPELRALVPVDGSDTLTVGPVVGAARLAAANEVRPHGITALAGAPRFLRSEAMLDGFGVSEDIWRDAAAHDPHLLASETSYLVGPAVAALPGDPHIHIKSGRLLTSWDLAAEYDLHDVDGNRPHWGRHFATQVLPNAT